MFCVGIAAARMNLFRGSLYNLASATHGFLWHYSFQASQSNWVWAQLCTKPSILRASKCWDSDFWDAAHEITETIERLCSSCCLLVFKTSEKFLSSSRHTMTLKNHVSSCISLSAWIIYVEVCFHSFSACTVVCWFNFKLSLWNLRLLFKNNNLLDIVVRSWIQGKSFISFNKVLLYKAMRLGQS